MPNKNYIRGVRFERDVRISECPEDGFACRTAGSHGPYDVIVVDYGKKRIKLIQCKTKTKATKSEVVKTKLKTGGVFTVSFEKWTKHIK